MRGTLPTRAACGYVAWDSQASNLTDTAQTERLAYRPDLQTGTTILVSRATGGALPNAAATTPVMSEDGNRVVFSTFAGNLSTLDQDGGAHDDLFVRDVNAATTELVTPNTPGQGQDVSQGAGF